MSKTTVMTLRLPLKVARGVKRLASRYGHKPAQLGMRFVEEGLRRRDYPQIDLRETSGGRVAYLGGTRFAVYWILAAIEAGATPEDLASEYELPLERMRMALTYAAAFPEEIKADTEHAQANREWLAHLEAAHHCKRSTSLLKKANTSAANQRRGRRA
jgi:uncharacterized protein (DUF433 family)